MGLCITQALYAYQLKKVYLHTAPMASEAMDTFPQIEVAKLALCFADKPNMHKLASSVTSDNWQHDTYEIIDVDIDHAEKTLKQIAQENHHYYRIVYAYNKEQRTMIIDLYYDPACVTCYNDSFDAITHDKGIVFRFINKKLLEGLAKQEKPFIQVASAKKPTVVIDVAHGGRDPGALGCNGIAEKLITLPIGLELAHLLQQSDYIAYLTRDKDVTVSLTDRTSFINRIRPDLYVSIHANSSYHHHIQGLETFCLHQSCFLPQYQEVDVVFRRIMSDLYQQSNRLGEAIHTCILSHMHRQGKFMCDRTLRHAVPQLLLGTNVPGILIEVGYLSNDDEATRLMDTLYQKDIAKGIYNGIIAFITA